MSDMEYVHGGDRVMLKPRYMQDNDSALGTVLGPGRGWSYVILLDSGRVTTLNEGQFLDVTEQPRTAPSDTIGATETSRSTMAETVSSSSDAVTLGNAKGIAGGAAGTAVAFLTGLSFAIQDGAVSPQEWVNIALATVIGAVAAFGITYATPTKVTIN